MNQQKMILKLIKKRLILLILCLLFPIIGNSQSIAIKKVNNEVLVINDNINSYKKKILEKSLHEDLRLSYTLLAYYDIMNDSIVKLRLVYHNLSEKTIEEHYFINGILFHSSIKHYLYHQEVSSALIYYLKKDKVVVKIDGSLTHFDKEEIEILKTIIKSDVSLYKNLIKTN